MRIVCEDSQCYLILQQYDFKYIQTGYGTVQTWSEAVTLLTTAFGQQKVSYGIYRELFAHEQDSKTSTDVFISRSRSLLATILQGDLLEKV